jgi:hypothetical protein
MWKHRRFYHHEPLAQRRIRMKKTMFKAVLLIAAFATLVGSCASTGKGGNKKIKEAHRYALQGNRYVSLFREYQEWYQERYWELLRDYPDFRDDPNYKGTLTRTTNYTSENPDGTTSTWTEKLEDGAIDLAIEAYEKSLKLVPSGTWEVESTIEITERVRESSGAAARRAMSGDNSNSPRTVTREESVVLKSPEGGVKPRLEEAKN